eukprot:m51a1_g6113 hypothetical protein (100) ;mRNA; f:110475-110821
MSHLLASRPAHDTQLVLPCGWHAEAVAHQLHPLRLTHSCRQRGDALHSPHALLSALGTHAWADAHHAHEASAAHQLFDRPVHGIVAPSGEPAAAGGGAL